MNNVVVGVDGSPSGRGAIEWAVAKVTDEVHAVHAVSPAMELLAAGFQIDTGPLVERVTEQLNGPWTAGLRHRQPKLFTHLVEDSPVLALLATASSCSSDAIVVGVRGHSPSSKMVGATTGQLVHLSDFPVVVVPTSGDQSAPTTDDEVIVVGLADRPEEDAELLRWTCETVAAPTARLELVCADPRSKATRSGPATPADEHPSTARIRRWVDDQDLQLPFSLEVVGSDPITALSEASRHAAMVIVGSHRSSRLAAYLSGALANHLPSVSACPVALVPVTANRP